MKYITLVLVCLFTLSCEIPHKKKVTIPNELLLNLGKAILSSEGLIEFETDQLKRNIETEIFDRGILYNDSIKELIDKVLIEYEFIEGIYKNNFPDSYYQVSSEEAIHQLRTQISVSKDNILSKIDSFLINFGDKYGLNKEEIQNKIEYFETLFKPLELAELFDREDFEIDNYHYDQLLLIYQIRKVKYELLFELSLFVRLERVYFERHFPVVLDPKNEYLSKAKNIINIGVGTYYTYMDKGEIKISVNGQEQQINQGIIKYELPTKQQGEHKIDIEMISTNSITGEIYTSTSSYTYSVIEE
ncbi:MAG: hypothetical protein DHS20C18_27760 [Saprospiraceae bacterium]|nr:MAG: hypothetical protein DHS20C18_27760 [Saprospiraceae bacterium]